MERKTMTISFDVISLAVASIMVGNEVAVAAFVNPVLWRMEERTHAQTAAALAGVTNSVMPLWYILTLILTLAVIWEHRTLDFDHGPGLLLAVAAGGWFISVTLTLTRIIPLSKRIAHMDPDLPHREWLVDRSRWDGLQRWRLCLLLISLALFSSSILGAWRDFVPAVAQRIAQL
jgi:hypothetical protein